MNHEERIAKLEALVEQLTNNKYIFSGKEEWKKDLTVPTLVATTFAPTNLTVSGTANFTGTLQGGGFTGLTTSFSTSPSVTVTVKKGLITNVV